MFLVLIVITPLAIEMAVVNILLTAPSPTYSVVVINALSPNSFVLSSELKSLIVIVSGKYPSAPGLPPPGNSVLPAATKNTTGVFSPIPSPTFPSILSAFVASDDEVDVVEVVAVVAVAAVVDVAALPDISLANILLPPKANFVPTTDIVLVPKYIVESVRYKSLHFLEALPKSLAPSEVGKKLVSNCKLLLTSKFNVEVPSVIDVPLPPPPPEDAIVTSVALFLVKVMFEPAVSCTVESSVVDVEFKFKSTLEPSVVTFKS